MAGCKLQYNTMKIKIVCTRKQGEIAFPMRTHNDGPSTDFAILARAETSFSGGSVNGIHNTNKLHDEGRTVRNGLLINEQATKRYGQFGQVKLAEGKWEYTEKLARKTSGAKLKTFAHDAEIVDINDTNALITKLLQVRGYHANAKLKAMCDDANSLKGTTYITESGKEKKHDGKLHIRVNAQVTWLNEKGKKQSIHIDTITIKKVFTRNTLVEIAPATIRTKTKIAVSDTSTYTERKIWLPYTNILGEEKRFPLTVKDIEQASYMVTTVEQVIPVAAKTTLIENYDYFISSHCINDIRTKIHNSAKVLTSKELK